jgi:D-arabinose 1-dehydrogenase-like Zn-dependent alcohol dehydrogenase
VPIPEPGPGQVLAKVIGAGGLGQMAIQVLKAETLISLDGAADAYHLLHDGKIQGRAVITPND